MNPIYQFQDAITQSGLTPPLDIIADGKIHRFSSDGKLSNRNGWYVMYQDEPSVGVFGDWSKDFQSKWMADIGRAYTPDETKAYQRKIELAKEEFEQAKLVKQAQAQREVNEIWDEAEPAKFHSYLAHKKIKAYKIRQLGDELLIPMFQDGNLMSLQHIQPDGSKRFHGGGKTKGTYFPIGGKPQDGESLCVCEGYATGASIHEATGYPVAIAFTANNLLSVAQNLRKKFPDARIVICADDDFKTDGNIGIEKANETALVISGLLAIPIFGSERTDKQTDFNDMVHISSLKAVKQAIDNATPPQQGVIETTPQKDSQLLVNLLKGSDVTIRPIVWVWDQWLPSGKLTMLAGAGGTGKTTLSLSIGATITTGGVFPNGSRFNGRGNVLIWSSEDDPEDVLIPRAKAMGSDLSRIHILTDTTEKGKNRVFNPVSDIEALKNAINQIGGVSLIIIDPIVGMIQGNMNNANVVRQSLEPLVQFAQEQKCAIIGISHLGKGTQDRDPAERILGSQAFTALPRMVWVTAENNTTGDRVLVRAKTNISRKDGGFIYTTTLAEVNGFETSIVQWKGEIEGNAQEILRDAEGSGEEETELSEGEKFLVDLLSHETLSATAVKSEASSAGISWTTIRRASKSLGVRKYKSGMSGGWFWTLAEDAQKLPKMLVDAEDAHTFNNEHLFKNAEDISEDAHIQNVDRLRILHAPSHPFEESGDSYVESEI